MTGSSSRYTTRYPGSGKIAVLCEGDLVGYEADILAKWTSKANPEILVDVWPCGTKSAFFGMSDAIGRAIPMFVIEDRDFRSPAGAKSECSARMKDRTGRAIQVVAWQTWRRHEIENYLIEPDVVMPTLAEAFGVQPHVVQDRLTKVIECLRTDQAAQWVLSEFREALSDRNLPSYVGGLPRVTARPTWDSRTQRLTAPGDATVENEVGKLINNGLNSWQRDAVGIDAGALMGAFVAKRVEWSTVTFADQAWRIDWGGKEVLSALIRWLAGEFGLAKEAPAKWAEMSRPESESVERTLVVTLQPSLVERFLSFLEATTDADLRQEWDEINKLVAAATQP